jgi:flagellar basal-body rod protein FlgF
MQASLYVALSAQLALRNRLDTVAHNVANAGTAGFRAEEIRFEAILANAGEQEVAFASQGASHLSRRQGGITQTGNPLDFAISGDGWFAIQGASGPVYTRDGRMRMSNVGMLETLDGRAVLDAGGAPIQIDPAAGPPVVAADGMIMQGAQQAGAIGLFEIEAGAKLTRAEGSAVIPDRPARAIVEFTKSAVMQGYSEKSNVNPVLEMTRLIAIQRTFESVAKNIESTESVMNDALKTLGSTG